MVQRQAQGRENTTKFSSFNTWRSLGSNSRESVYLIQSA